LTRAALEVGVGAGDDGLALAFVGTGLDSAFGDGDDSGRSPNVIVCAAFAAGVSAGGAPGSLAPADSASSNCGTPCAASAGAGFCATEAD
jgi:hypothetical protein